MTEAACVSASLTEGFLPPHVVALGHVLAAAVFYASGRGQALELATGRRRGAQDKPGCADPRDSLILLHQRTTAKTATKDGLV